MCQSRRVRIQLGVKVYGPLVEACDGNVSFWNTNSESKRTIWYEERILLCWCSAGTLLDYCENLVGVHRCSFNDANLNDVAGLR
jgi:hypothetical protein